MMKILIADDDTLSRKLLKRLLERADYEVVAVEDGRRATRELCQSEGPRLALLDWMMPELDGPDVCREVRRHRSLSYVYMILLTSKESKQEIVEGLQAGADDYLIKPFDPEELKARLRTGLRILQLEDKLVEAREDMRFRATHDPLTGLFNRGVILDLLGRELARTRREQGCTTIILGDVDHFKNVNDTYGHVVGDEVLSEVARRLLASVRSYDFVGRYGGEEFLVVLNNCNTSFGMARAEEIRKTVANGAVETSRGPVSVTMSFGVLSSRDWGILLLDELLHRTDIALYASKAAGRNRCTMAKCDSTDGSSLAPVHATSSRLR